MTLRLFFAALIACSFRLPAQANDFEHLREYLQLPALMEKYLGSSHVEFRKSPDAKSYLHRVTVNEAFPAVKNGPYARYSRGTFVVFTPLPHNDLHLKKLLAREALRQMLDVYFPSAAKRISLLQMPLDPRSSMPLRERIFSYGINRLAGLPNIGDVAMDLWWALRLDTDGIEKKPVPTAGDQVVGEVWLRDYHGASNAIDWGHAGLALITLGGNPANDLFIDGSSRGKNFEALNWPAVNFPKQNIFDKVDITNFWDWAENSTQNRYLSVWMSILPLSLKQTQAIDLIASHGRGLVYGDYFRGITNNCATAARDILDSLLPLDQELNVEILGLDPLVTPSSDYEHAREGFGELGRVILHHPTKPADVINTPGGNQITHPDRRSLKTYQEFELWTHKHLLNGN